MQNAYLGARGNQQIDLDCADFYRADLSGASLKGAKAPAAVFYQARMTDAVLRNADLRGANFFEAELWGVNFDGAKLAGASFERTKSVPPELQRFLKEGRWHGPEVFRSSWRLSEGYRGEVYVSKPGCLNAAQEKIVDLVCGWLSSSDFKAAGLPRADYPATGALAEIRRRMSDCAGAVVFGFEELKISDGSWRAGTIEEAKLCDKAFRTVWCEIEAGMAAMINLPLLLIMEPGLTKGIFEASLVEHNIFRMSIPPDRSSPIFRDWLAAVGERAIRA